MISLVACTLTLFCSASALGMELVLYGVNDWKLSDLLYIKRENEMISSCKEDADPVEVKIEVYGLGRYYGLHGEKTL